MSQILDTNIIIRLVLDHLERLLVDLDDQRGARVTPPKSELAQSLFQLIGDVDCLRLDDSKFESIIGVQKILFGVPLYESRVGGEDMRSTIRS